MISVILLVLYSGNFVYLFWWTKKTLGDCSSCDDAIFPAKTPEPSFFSIIVMGLCILHFAGLAFWGATDNPYHKPGEAWLRAGDDASLFVVGMVGWCLGMICFVFYMFGKLSGVLETRRREIRRREEDRRQQAV